MSKMVVASLIISLLKDYNQWHVFSLPLKWLTQLEGLSALLPVGHSILLVMYNG